MKKAIPFIAVLVAVSLGFLHVLSNSYANVGSSNQVIFTSRGKIYSGHLNKTGRRLIAKIKGAKDLEVIDSTNQGDLLLETNLNSAERKELILYSRGKTKVLFKDNSELGLEPPFDSTSAGYAAFGKNSNEIYFAQSEGQDGNRKTYISKMHLPTGRTSRMVLPRSLGGNYFRYSKKLDAFLVNILTDNPWSAKNICLYTVADSRLTGLANGDDFVWLKDGESFLFTKYDRIYKYDLKNKKASLLYKIGRKWRGFLGIYRFFGTYRLLITSISPDDKYLLGYQSYFWFELDGALFGTLDDQVVISLASGRSEIVDDDRLFGPDKGRGFMSFVR